MLQSLVLQFDTATKADNSVDFTSKITRLPMLLFQFQFFSENSCFFEISASNDHISDQKATYVGQPAYWRPLLPEIFWQKTGFGFKILKICSRAKTVQYSWFKLQHGSLALNPHPSDWFLSCVYSFLFPGFTRLWLKNWSILWLL